MNGGVYVMYNRDNNIIYVGQSNSLKEDYRITQKMAMELP